MEALFRVRSKVSIRLWRDRFVRGDAHFSCCRIQFEREPMPAACDDQGAAGCADSAPDYATAVASSATGETPRVLVEIWCLLGE